MNIRTDKVTVFIARKIGGSYELLQLRRCDGEHIAYNAENDAHRWFPAAEAETFFMWPSERPLLEVLRQEIFADSPAKTQLRVDSTK
jgi:hypothetical protein